LVLPHSLVAQETAVRATVLAVTGSATVRLPDGSSVPAATGLRLAQGAVIATGSNAQVSIEVHDGIVAVLAGTSNLELEKLNVSANGTRNAMMNLTLGSLASSLDPSRKSLNNYGVRTAKGVAMARGTTMTVSVAVTVNGNFYTVSVLAGNVTVNWQGGRSVSIEGNTPSDVTSNGQQAMSLHEALATGGVTGLSDALTAAAVAVATVATNTAQVTAVINTIAVAAGTGPAAAATVASATAAATGAAVNNAALVTAAGSTTAVASTISTAAVTSATAAGNSSAAALIVTSAVNAVANIIPGTNVNAVATALTSASNSVPGSTPILAGQVTAGVNAAQNPVTIQGFAVGNNPTRTPISPIDPAVFIVVSPSGG
jgi:hypothetical protein